MQFSIFSSLSNYAPLICIFKYDKKKRKEKEKRKQGFQDKHLEATHDSFLQDKVKLIREKRKKNLSNFSLSQSRSVYIFSIEKANNMGN